MGLLLDAAGNNLSELTINNSYEGKRHELIYDDVPNVSSVKIVGRVNTNVELAMVEVEGVRTLESLITDDATATQSSTYQGHYVAKNAIDKDMNSFSHTNYGDAEWWKVNLGLVATVSKVFVYNRADCCAERLNDAIVLLLDATGNNLSELTINNSYEGKRHELIYDDVPNVSSVKIVGRDNFVELAMVEVEGVRTLESLITDDATATQSSTYQGHYVAKNAIDKDMNSFSHTYSGDAEWWKVDLGFVATVSKVFVYNRHDCCAERLDNAKVLLLDAAGNKLSELTINNSDENERHQLIYDDVANVSSVKIVGRDNTSVELAMVEVEGVRAPESY